MRVRGISIRNFYAVLKKMIAVMLCVCMISQAALAQPPIEVRQAAPLNQVGSPKLEVGRKKQQISAPIELPANLGRIEEFYEPPRPTTHASRPTVYYIQDAHDSLEAQENIAKIISDLVKNYGVKTVFEEGYEGKVPTDEYFGGIQDPELKEKVSYFLMDQLRVSGAEYAHINRGKAVVRRGSWGMSKKNLSKSKDARSKAQGIHRTTHNPRLKTHDTKLDFELIGADSLDLHAKNVEWYQKSAKHREETNADLKVMDTEIRAIASKHFSKPLKEWMKQKERFQQGEIDLLDYLKRLRALSPTEIADLDYPNISRLLRPEQLDDSQLFPDAKELLREIDKLEDEFAEHFLETARDFKDQDTADGSVSFPPLRGDKDRTRRSLDKAALVQSPSSHGGGHVDTADGSVSFPRKRESERPDSSHRSPISSKRWRASQSGMTDELLVKQPNEEVNTSALSRNHQTFHYYKLLQLLKRLNAIEITEEEYEVVKDDLKEIDTQKMAQFITEQARKSMILSKKWERNIQNAIQFYKTAHKRDQAIETTLRKYMTEDGKTMDDEHWTGKEKGLKAEGGRWKGKEGSRPSLSVHRPSSGVSRFPSLVHHPSSDVSRSPAILVFGGFHKENIKKILRENGFSYIVITPKITQVSERHQDYYKRLMSLGHHPFEVPRLVARATATFHVMNERDPVHYDSAYIQSLGREIEALGDVPREELAFRLLPRLKKSRRQASTALPLARARSEVRMDVPDFSETGPKREEVSTNPYESPRIVSKSERGVFGVLKDILLGENLVSSLRLILLFSLGLIMGKSLYWDEVPEPIVNWVGGFLAITIWNIFIALDVARRGILAFEKKEFRQQFHPLQFWALIYIGILSPAIGGVFFFLGLNTTDFVRFVIYGTLVVGAGAVTLDLLLRKSIHENRQNDAQDSPQGLADDALSGSSTDARSEMRVDRDNLPIKEAAEKIEGTNPYAAPQPVLAPGKGWDFGQSKLWNQLHYHGALPELRKWVAPITASAFILAFAGASWWLALGIAGVFVVVFDNALIALGVLVHGFVTLLNREFREWFHPLQFGLLTLIGFSSPAIVPVFYSLPLVGPMADGVRSVAAVGAAVLSRVVIEWLLRLPDYEKPPAVKVDEFPHPKDVSRSEVRKPKKILSSLTDEHFDSILDAGYAARIVLDKTLVHRRPSDFLSEYPALAKVLLGFSDMALTENPLSTWDQSDIGDLLFLTNQMTGTKFDLLMLPDGRGLFIHRKPLKFAAVKDSGDQNLWHDFYLDFHIMEGVFSKKGFFYSHLLAQAKTSNKTVIQAAKLFEALQNGETQTRRVKNPITEIYFPSAKEPEILKRAVGSYLESLRDFGHTLPVIWIVEAAESAVAARKREMLQELAEEYEVEFRYVSAEKKQELLELLASQPELASKGLTPEWLRELYYPEQTFGTDRNYVQTLSSGAVYMTVDDDSLGEKTIYRDLGSLYRDVRLMQQSQSRFWMSAWSEMVTLIDAWASSMGRDKVSQVAEALDEIEMFFSNTIRAMDDVDVVGATFPTVYFYKLLGLIDDVRKIDLRLGNALHAELMIAVDTHVKTYLEMPVRDSGEQQKKYHHELILDGASDIAHVAVPINVYGAHGRVITKPVETMMDRQFAIDTGAYMSDPVEGEALNGTIAMVLTNSNINGAGSIQHDLDVFLRTGDPNDLAGRPTNDTILWYESWDYVLGRTKIHTVTATTIDNRRLPGRLGGLMAPGEPDSAPLGVVAGRDDPSFLIYESSLAPDHRRIPSTVRYGRLQGVARPEEYSRRLLHFLTQEFAHYVYFHPEEYPRLLRNYANELWRTVLDLRRFLTEADSDDWGPSEAKQFVMELLEAIRQELGGHEFPDELAANRWSDLDDGEDAFAFSLSQLGLIGRGSLFYGAAEEELFNPGRRAVRTVDELLEDAPLKEAIASRLKQRIAEVAERDKYATHVLAVAAELKAEGRLPFEKIKPASRSELRAKVRLTHGKRLELINLAIQNLQAAPDDLNPTGMALLIDLRRQLAAGALITSQQRRNTQTKVMTQIKPRGKGIELGPRIQQAYDALATLTDAENLEAELKENDAFVRLMLSADSPLTAKEKKVLQMRNVFMDDKAVMSFSEIARELKLSQSSARVSLEEALALIRHFYLFVWLKEERVRSLPQDGAEKIQPKSLPPEVLKDIGVQRLGNFTVRAKKAFRTLGIYTVGDLTDTPETRFREVTNFGPTTLRSVKAVLGRHGLRLARSEVRNAEHAPLFDAWQKMIDGTLDAALEDPDSALAQALDQQGFVGQAVIPIPELLVRTKLRGSKNERFHYIKNWLASLNQPYFQQLADSLTSGGDDDVLRLFVTIENAIQHAEKEARLFLFNDAQGGSSIAVMTRGPTMDFTQWRNKQGFGSGGDNHRALIYIRNGNDEIGAGSAFMMYSAGFRSVFLAEEKEDKPFSTPSEGTLTVAHLSFSLKTRSEVRSKKDRFKKLRRQAGKRERGQETPAAVAELILAKYGRQKKIHYEEHEAVLDFASALTRLIKSPFGQDSDRMRAYLKGVLAALDDVLAGRTDDPYGYWFVLYGALARSVLMESEEDHLAQAEAAQLKSFDQYSLRWVGQKPANIQDVFIEPIRRADENMIYEWGARDTHFRAGWLDAVQGTKGGYKLVSVDTQGNTHLEGFVTTHVNSGGEGLDLPNIEVAPHNRKTAGVKRRFQGVGSVLYARAVVSSIERGFHGWVYAQPGAGIVEGETLMKSVGARKFDFPFVREFKEMRGLDLSLFYAVTPHVAKEMLARQKEIFLKTAEPGYVPVHDYTQHPALNNSRSEVRYAPAPQTVILFDGGSRVDQSLAISLAIQVKKGDRVIIFNEKESVGMVELLKSFKLPRNQMRFSSGSINEAVGEYRNQLSVGFVHVIDPLEGTHKTVIAGDEIKQRVAELLFEPGSLGYVRRNNLSAAALLDKQLPDNIIRVETRRVRVSPEARSQIESFYHRQYAVTLFTQAA